MCSNKYIITKPFNVCLWFRLAHTMCVRERVLAFSLSPLPAASSSSPSRLHSSSLPPLSARALICGECVRRLYYAVQLCPIPAPYMWMTDEEIASVSVFTLFGRIFDCICRFVAASELFKHFSSQHFSAKRNCGVPGPPPPPGKGNKLDSGRIFSMVKPRNGRTNTTK